MTAAVELHRRALGAYLGLAVGDALGATTEFMTPAEIAGEFGVHRNLCGGGWLRLRPGQVTDDTEMSLALGRSILATGRVEAVAVANAYSDWMRGKPVDIGHTVRRGIVRFRSSGETCVPPNEQDAGNGACMRTLPVALAYWNAPLQRLREASRAQCHVTHNNPIADAGTETVLQMLVHALRGGNPEALSRFAQELVERHPCFRFDRARAQNPSGWIVDTLKAVFQAFFSHGSFEDILVDVVNRGGDADTTGAIAGMLAGACYGVDAIPRRWSQRLDANIREACRQQAMDLLEQAHRRFGRPGEATGSSRVAAIGRAVGA